MNSNRNLYQMENVSEHCLQGLALANYPPQGERLPLPLLVLFCIPAIVIILLTVFGNLLVLFFKAKVGRTNTTLLVWNLGLTDFLVGVIVLPLGAFHLTYRKWIFGRFLCRVWVAADVTFCTCSVVTICVISVDRYLAVTRPLRYKSIVTKTKVIMVLLIIWTFSSTILLATVHWEQPPCHDDSVCFAGNEIRFLAHSVIFAFFLPASVTLTLYWRIYRLARNRQRALDRGFLMILGQNMNFLTNTISQQTTLRVHFGKNANNGMVEHQRRVLRTHERIAKTLGVVSCSFLFCWLPFFSLYLTNYKCSGCIPPIAIDIASWLGYCNSMLNPIIYSFTVKEFKRSAIRLVVPIWQFLHTIMPFFFTSPPDRILQRMSRHGARAKNQKTRHRSFELGANKSGVLTSRVCHKRRQTEPAVFGIHKKLCPEEEAAQKEMMIIEEDDEAIHEYTETNGYTTTMCYDGGTIAPPSSQVRRLSDVSCARLSNREPILYPITEDKVPLPLKNSETIKIPLRKNGSLANGDAKKVSEDSGSLHVYCETSEADL